MKPAVVILAGGEGRRIGGSKPHKLLAGRTLLDRALDQARQWSDEVAVAVRDKGQVAGTDVAILVDEPSVEGPVGGLVAALQYGRECGVGAVLTIAADMPFLPDDLADRLAGGIGGAAAAIASSGGRLHPVCGLWRVSALARMPQYVASGRRSLKGFAEHCGFVEVQWPVEGHDPFFNINDRADLAAAERQLRG